MNSYTTREALASDVEAWDWLVSESLRLARVGVLLKQNYANEFLENKKVYI